MALNKPQLKEAIKSILADMAQVEEDPEAAREEFAEKISSAIDAFVRTGKVDVYVNTTGTATSHTGSGTGSIS